MMKILLSILLIIVSFSFGFSQVGINTTDPDASAALDIVNDERGVLIPRMTTTGKIAIANPAHSLLVYDTDLEGYYFNQGTPTTPNWIPLLSDKDQRDNYVLVKSESDFPAASSGGTINLNEDTYYEINGEITLSASINLNNAYVSGLDATEDVLSYPGGTVFAGNTGGNIRNVTIQGSQAFNITGPGITTNSSLLLQNSVVAGNTTVGTITSLGLVFSNIVQFINNQGGITYSNIGNLLLNNQAWFDSNSGTYETFTGTFGFIEKVSGFSTVPSGATGVDVSSNPTVGSAVMSSTVFNGLGDYVLPYTSGNIYVGYNFTNEWEVNCVGIPKETDDVASGDMTLSAPVGSGELTTFSGTGSNSRKKLSGTTSSSNLFRFAKDGDNRLKYEGNRTRFFNINVSMSYQATADMTLILYVAKNNSVVDNTKVYGKGANGFFVTDGGILALPIVASLKLNKNDYIEVWAERYSGSGNIQTVSLSLSIN